MYVVPRTTGSVKSGLKLTWSYARKRSAALVVFSRLSRGSGGACREGLTRDEVHGGKDGP